MPGFAAASSGRRFGVARPTRRDVSPVPLRRRAPDGYTVGRVAGDAYVTLLLAGLAAVVLAAFAWHGRRLVPPRLPYFAKETLCSRGELAFYRALSHAVPAGFGISMKTRLGDVIGCTAEGWRTGFGAKISQKHVDFVVFDPVTTAIILVIELDDRTHRLPDRQDRDVFVDQALAAAGVAILRVPAAREYDLEDLREQVGHAVRHTVGA